MNIKRITTAPVNGSNEIQTLTFGGTPTGGTFKLVLGSLVSGSITWSATNATLIANIQAALDTLLGTNNTLVAEATMTAGIGTATVTFQNAYGVQLQANTLSAQSSLTGSSPTLTAAVTTAGVTATFRDSATGQLLMNTAATPPALYQNVSATSLAPNWVPFGQSGIISKAIGSPALGTTTAVHAAITQPSSGTTTVTTVITNPDVPRNLTITGNQATCTGNVVITGTDANNAALTETIAASGTSTVVGNKAFKTVTSIVIPTRGAASDTIAIGTGAKLGLGDLLSRNTVLKGYLGGTLEGTAPTVAFSSSAIASNTVTLNSALNGTAVIVDYYQS